MRLDPSETTMIRRAFERAVSVRLDLLKKGIAQHIAPEPMTAEKLLGNVSDAERMKAFREWLQQRIDEGLLYVDNDEVPWFSTFVVSAYKKALARAFTDVKKKRMGRQGSGFLEGARSFFVSTQMQSPERLDKIKTLYTRAYENLKGMTAQMAAKMTTILADGLAKGASPREIAKELAKTIDGLGKTRALTIARTEIIHAHAEGQLDSFQALGVDQIGIYAEWSTAGDDRVCENCAENEGALFTVDEARGMIPLHPNCRCAWIPSNEVADRERLKRKQ